MPEMCTLISGCPLIPECITLLNGTLGHVRYTIVVRRSSLPYAVPVKRDFVSYYTIFHVNNDFVTLANLNARSRDHSVRGHDTPLHAVRQNALTLAPHGIGGVRCAYLTRCAEYGV